MNPVSVIIADDSVLMRSKIKSILAEAPGIEIKGEAQNGIEAVTLVKQLNPDAILLDLKMPLMSGIEALKEIRSFNSEIKIIMLTGHANEKYKKLCLESGANSFFDKSTEYDFLVKAIIQQTD